MNAKRLVMPAATAVVPEVKAPDALGLGLIHQCVAREARRDREDAVAPERPSVRALGTLLEKAPKRAVVRRRPRRPECLALLEVSARVAVEAQRHERGFQKHANHFAHWSMHRLDRIRAADASDRRGDANVVLAS